PKHRLLHQGDRFRRACDPQFGRTEPLTCFYPKANTHSAFETSRSHLMCSPFWQERRTSSHRSWLFLLRQRLAKSALSFIRPSHRVSPWVEKLPDFPPAFPRTDSLI